MESLCQAACKKLNHVAIGEHCDFILGGGSRNLALQSQNHFFGVTLRNNMEDWARNNYTQVNGGWKGHKSPHLNGSIPAGGNALYLDSHVA